MLPFTREGLLMKENYWYHKKANTLVMILQKIYLLVYVNNELCWKY